MSVCAKQNEKKEASRNHKYVYSSSAPMTYGASANLTQTMANHHLITQYWQTFIRLSFFLFPLFSASLSLSLTLFFCGWCCVLTRQITRNYLVELKMYSICCQTYTKYNMRIQQFQMTASFFLLTDKKCVRKTEKCRAFDMVQRWCEWKKIWFMTSDTFARLLLTERDFGYRTVICNRFRVF